MKKFSQFLTEAETTVSAKARKMGLKGDGHGGWYDQQGNFKAKTVGKDLKMVSGREAKVEDDKRKKAKAIDAAGGAKKAGSDPTSVARKAVQSQQQKSGQASGGQASAGAAGGEEGQETETGSEGIVLVFGRFNPLQLDTRNC